MASLQQLMYLEAAGRGGGGVDRTPTADRFLTEYKSFTKNEDAGLDNMKPVVSDIMIRSFVDRQWWVKDPKHKVRIC